MTKSNTPHASDLAREVGKRLAEVRSERGLSQKQFAAALGTSNASYQKYEYGERELPISIAARLYVEHKVNPAWLLQGPDTARVRCDQTDRASGLAQRTYKVWESLLSKSAAPVPIEARSLLFDVFVDMAIRSGDMPTAQMEQAAAKLIEKIAPKD